MRAHVIAALGALLVAGTAATLRAEDARPLILERTIALPGTAGRIDHLAVDLARKRLFVAELGNNTVDIVDIGAGRVLRRIKGLSEPQGVAYVPGADVIVIANGGDGSVRFFTGGDAAPLGTIAPGDDADNVRVDARSGHVVVGYGAGALAIVDPAARAKIGEIRLAAHPEGFQIDPKTARVFVNVPNAGHVARVDLAARRQTAEWRTPGLRANFPMAIAPDGAGIAIVFRRPATLVLLDPESGAERARLDTCNDSDDVFFDARRMRLYVSCGDGHVDVIAQHTGGLRPLARIRTRAGARTSLFVPELDRLFVAARADFGADAAILVFRPAP